MQGAAIAITDSGSDTLDQQTKAGLDPSSVLERLGDAPQSIECRAMLLENKCCFIFGMNPSDCVVVQPALRLASMIGLPETKFIRQGLEHCPDGCTLLATSSQFAAAREAAPGWMASAAYRLIHTGVLPWHVTPTNWARLLEPAQLPACSEFPEHLVNELAGALAESEAAASWIGSRPVSVCYPAWETEGLWDVAVHTLPRYRRLGHAVTTILFLIRRFANRGKRAVWFADADNLASLDLARKLRFTTVEKLTVFRMNAKGD